MDLVPLQLIVFGILAAMANVLGGLILLPGRFHSAYKSSLKYLLALGAGFMLAVTFFEVIPKTISIWQKSGGASGENLISADGPFVGWIFAHTVLRAHDRSAFSSRGGNARRDFVIYVFGLHGNRGLLIHTFFDGVSIAAASYVDVGVGFLVFIAVFLHKFPEGFTIGSMLVAAGKGTREIVIATSVIGAATLLGVLLFALVGSRIDSSVAYALPIASGVTLYVAASDLIPEVNHHGGKRPLVLDIRICRRRALFRHTPVDP